MTKGIVYGRIFVMSEHLNIIGKIDSIIDHPNTPKAILDGVSGGIVIGAEAIRASLVDPSGNPLGEPGRASILSSDSPFYTVLKCSGDFGDGFLMALGGYYALKIVDFFQSRISNKHIPSRLQLALSMFFSIGVVSLVENGILHDPYVADIRDIPAGVLGASAYVGFNVLSRKFVESRAKRKKAILAEPTENVMQIKTPITGVEDEDLAIET